MSLVSFSRLIFIAALFIGSSHEESYAAKPQPASAPADTSAQHIVIEDVLGRKVSVRYPVRRMILEESRQLYTVAALEQGNPLKRIVGWGSDLQQADPDTYAEYRQKFPEIDRIPLLGSFAAASFNLEKAVSLKPDVVFLNMETERIAKDADYIGKLGKLGIPVVYVDFRHHPEKNTEPTIRLFGALLGQPTRANDLIHFRRQEIAKVVDVLAKQPVKRPTVFIERIAGLTEECCFSFGKENIGRYVDLAGGNNIADKLIPGTFGQLSPEQVMATNPQHVIVTSADWRAYNPSGKWVPVGPGANAERVQRALTQFLRQPAYIGTDAARNRQIHAIWHQFYNSPYDFVVIQQIARWLHPALFGTLDADDTFRRFHNRFLPVTYRSGYFASLAGKQ
jgi:iron complex transport system substrate-binding protein